jgi:hypothetical protein
MSVPTHDLQSELWTSTLRTLGMTNREWSRALGVDEAEVSRWASGTRAMSIDDLAMVVVVCRRKNKPQAIAKIREVILGVLDEAGTATGDEGKTSGNPIGAVSEAAKAAGHTADTMERVLEDGDVDGEDAPELDRAAEVHEAVAGKLRGLAARARGEAVVNRGKAMRVAR